MYILTYFFFFFFNMIFVPKKFCCLYLKSNILLSRNSWILWFEDRHCFSCSGVSHFLFILSIALEGAKREETTRGAEFLFRKAVKQASVLLGLCWNKTSHGSPILWLNMQKNFFYLNNANQRVRIGVMAFR